MFQNVMLSPSFQKPVEGKDPNEHPLIWKKHWKSLCLHTVSRAAKSVQNLQHIVTLVTFSLVFSKISSGLKRWCYNSIFTLTVKPWNQFSCLFYMYSWMHKINMWGLWGFLSWYFMRTLFWLLYCFMSFHNSLQLRSFFWTTTALWLFTKYLHPVKLHRINRVLDCVCSARKLVLIHWKHSKPSSSLNSSLKGLLNWGIKELFFSNRCEQHSFSDRFVLCAVGVVIKVMMPKC